MNLVLLDRDGVINEDLHPGVTRPEEFRLLPGALEAIATLTQAGFRIAVVTNQSAIAKGLTTAATVDAIHRRLAVEAEAAGGLIQRFYVCPDHPERPTPRRKPAPGMLLEALAEFGAEAARTPFVGDDLRDLQAAYAAGCPRILVKTGKGARVLAEGLPEALSPVMVAADLRAAARHILEHYR
jgi:D-glycero-D-manno-heptose 1,7-bisphosphate phosphatase